MQTRASLRRLVVHRHIDVSADILTAQIRPNLKSRVFFINHQLMQHRAFLQGAMQRDKRNPKFLDQINFALQELRPEVDQAIDLAAADHALKGIALHFRIVIVDDHNIIASAAQLALKLIENMRKHQVFAQAVKVEREKHPDRIRFAGFETARLRIEHKTVFLRLLFNIDSRFFAYGRTTVKRPRNGRLRYADQFCKFPRSHQAKPLLPFFR